MAGGRGTKGLAEYVPSKMSHITYSHTSLAKPNPMVKPKFKSGCRTTIPPDGQRRMTPSMGKQLNHYHINFPKQQSLHPCSLTGGKRVQIRNFGVCAWSLKPRQRECFLPSSNTKTEQLQSSMFQCRMSALLCSVNTQIPKSPSEKVSSPLPKPIPT